MSIFDYTDLWPRFFTDLIVVCRMRQVARIFSTMQFDFSATEHTIYDGGISTTQAVADTSGSVAGKTIVLHNHIYCRGKCNRKECFLAAIVFNGKNIYISTMSRAHPLAYTGGGGAGGSVGSGCSSISPLPRRFVFVPPAPFVLIHGYNRLVIGANTYSTGIPGELIAEILLRFAGVTVELF